MERILLFGGSFNPIHSGHIEIARRMSGKLGTDRIIFVPTGKSGYKETEDFASRRDRLNMCKIALQDTNIEISTVELDKEEQSYTYQTVQQLKAENPDSKLYFLCGSDMFLTLHTWRNPKDIFKYSAMAVALRGKDELELLEKYKKQYFADFEIVLIDAGKIDVSSSQIRKAIRNGEKPIGICDGVYDYIIEKRLYIKSEK